MMSLQHRGGPVPGCVVFGGHSQCPSLAGKWIACGSGAAGAAGAVTGQVAALQDAARVTTDGQACELPVVYGVRAHLKPPTRTASPQKQRFSSSSSPSAATARRSAVSVTTLVRAHSDRGGAL